MKKAEFRGFEFKSEKAYNVYYNSDFCFWKDERGVFFYSDNEKSEKVELGDMAAVESFLLEYAD